MIKIHGIMIQSLNKNNRKQKVINYHIKQVNHIVLDIAHKQILIRRLRKLPIPI